jgi:hypothetical protein
MSFFFDVWAYEGFILASDVRIIKEEKQSSAHKIACSASKSKTVCAIAVCGEYPQACINYFVEAINMKDTLKEIANYFASKWTRRYGGTQEYSAAHLVGFETITDSSDLVPQMWYWCNWLGPNPDHFKSKDRLKTELASFSDPIPSNNHIPWKIKDTTNKFPGPTLAEERSLVRSFLHVHEPLFTWNGDTQFWRSASGAVGSAMNLLGPEKSKWTIDEVGKLTGHCLRFLANLGALLPESTVGLSEKEDFDMIAVKPTGIKKLRWAKVQEGD